jgi:hypothetical protein
MTDRNAPPSANDGASDELFDRDFLDDSDSDFLAELDRVLATDGAPAKEAATTPSEPIDEMAEFQLDLEPDDFGAALTPDEKDADEAHDDGLTDATIHIDDLPPMPDPPAMVFADAHPQDREEPDWVTPASPVDEEASAASFDALLQTETTQATATFESGDASATELADEDTASLFAPTIDDTVSDDSPEEEVDGNIFDELLEIEQASASAATTAEPVDDQEEAELTLPTNDVPANTDAVPLEDLADDVIEPFSARYEAPLSNHATALEEPTEGLAETLEPSNQTSPATDPPPFASDNEVSQIALAAAASAASAGLTSKLAAENNAESETQTTPAQAQASSSAWNGLIALLAVLGLGGVGLALWQNKQTNNHLAHLANSPPPAVDATPAAALAAPSPLILERLDRTEQQFNRIEQRLDQEMTRVDGELNSLYEAVTARPTSTASDAKAAPTAHLSQLDEEINQLKEQFEILQNELSSTRQALSKKQQPSQPPTVATATPIATPEPTDSTPAKPAVKVSANKGRYVVNLMSFQQKAKAEGEMKRLLAEDIPVELITINSRGKTWHRLAVRGFQSFDDAKAYVESVRNHPGLGTAWIGRS